MPRTGSLNDGWTCLPLFLLISGLLSMAIEGRGTILEKPCLWAPSCAHLAVPHRAGPTPGTLPQLALPHAGEDSGMQQARVVARCAEWMPITAGLLNLSPPSFGVLDKPCLAFTSGLQPLFSSPFGVTIFLFVLPTFLCFCSFPQIPHPSV